MARLVRAATDRNPPTSGGGGCQQALEDARKAPLSDLPCLMPAFIQKIYQMESDPEDTAETYIAAIPSLLPALSPERNTGVKSIRLIRLL